MILLAFSAILLPPGPDQSRRVPAFSTDHYVCSAEREGRFGRIRYEVHVPLNGYSPYQRIAWSMLQRGEAPSFEATWEGSAPADRLPDGRDSMLVFFDVARPLAEEARLEIRGLSGKPAFVGPYRFAWRSPDRDLRYFEFAGRWREITGWMAGRGALIFVLVGRDGQVVAERRLDAATLASHADALAAVRPEIRAMAADYRRRCAFLDIRAAARAAKAGGRWLRAGTHVSLGR